MKLINTRWALPMAVAFMPLVASAQFTVVTQTARLEVSPGVVLNLGPGRLDSVPGYEFFQNSLDPECVWPRCQPTYFQELTGSSYVAANELRVGTSAYASGEPIDVVNKADFSLTFDISAQIDVFLTAGHYIGLDSTGFAPPSTSLEFGRLLGDGVIESVALPTLGSGFDEKQLRLTLQAGRYVMSSHIAFNPSTHFTSLPPGGAAWEGSGLHIREVPEPGSFALAFGGLLGLLAARVRRQQGSESVTLPA